LALPWQTPSASVRLCWRSDWVVTLHQGRFPRWTAVPDWPQESHRQQARQQPRQGSAGRRDVGGDGLSPHIADTKGAADEQRRLVPDRGDPTAIRLFRQCRRLCSLGGHPTRPGLPRDWNGKAAVDCAIDHAVRVRGWVEVLVQDETVLNRALSRTAVTGHEPSDLARQQPHPGCGCRG
jgi:hypothetical protein